MTSAVDPGVIASSSIFRVKDCVQFQFFSNHINGRTYPKAHVIDCCFVGQDAVQYATATDPHIRESIEVRGHRGYLKKSFLLNCVGIKR